MTVRRWLSMFMLLAFAHGSRADTLVFAAASLTNVLDEIAANYESRTGRKVLASYAASSVLARQIEAGSPAQIFIAADLDWMRYLQRRDLVAGRPHLLAHNRLVIIAPMNSDATLTIGKDMNLLSLLGGERLAIGDPAGVPAGRYARAALEYYGQWASIAKKVIPVENVRIALMLVETRAAGLGVVYATDAKVSSKVKVVGVFPDESHPPIVYPAALLREGRDADAEAFFAYLQSGSAAEVLRHAGFVVP
ncbi:MAG: Molybdate-binding protein ModA [Gammaproteobacteria bacterium]|nr:Molybdate-binding protein ModA [Gammaproteobacteria bacterium]